MAECWAEPDKMKLDPWQQEVMDTKGNIVLRSGRQVGKSTIVARKAGEYAVKHSKKTILVIAHVERQSLLLFEKIFEYLYTNHKSKIIMHGKKRPTRSKLNLINGSTIYSLPAGMDGRGIRGYTIDLLIADEGAFIEEAVWSAVLPMLAVTGGDIILLCTPFGKGGYFYRCFQDPAYTSFHISSEDCPRIGKEWLAQKKKEMSKLEYSQEFLGEFVDELRRFFSTEVIRQCMLPFKIPVGYKPYLGVDVARMGRDDSVLFSIVEHNNTLYQLDMQITSKTRLTETTRMILDADQIHNYKKIFIDDGGMGVGVFDPLLDHPQTKRKVIPINNSSRGLDSDKSDGRKKKLLKEDLYNNLLTLMEQGRLKLLNDPDIALSLKSIQCEYTDAGKMKIFGNYSHITEALVRAAWCVKTKSLNMYIHFQ